MGAQQKIKQKQKQKISITIVDSRFQKEELIIFTDETIDSVKRKLRKKRSIGKKFDLIYKKFFLEDNKAVSFYNIKNNSMIYYTGDLENDTKMQIFYKSLSGKTLTIDVEA